jgi:predicted alpha/beta hydrolase
MAESFTLQTQDGQPLACEWHAPTGALRAVAVIAPAMGVPRRYYGAFAGHLAANGVGALTLDYRGMGGSQPATGEVTLHAWAEQDLAALLRDAVRRAAGAPVVWVGHSVGGQLFGLLEPAEAAQVKRVLFVASQSGHWRNWPTVGQAVMFGIWHVGIPVLTAATGRLPMKAMGQGEDVPSGVAREWARWGRHRDYIGSYAQEKGGRAFASYTGPVRSCAFPDDSYAPQQSVEKLLGLYARAQHELCLITPASVGAKGIGHFGFFRPTFQATLWAQALDWLTAD